MYTLTDITTTNYLKFCMNKRWIKLVIWWTFIVQWQVQVCKVYEVDSGCSGHVWLTVYHCCKHLEGGRRERERGRGGREEGGEGKWEGEIATRNLTWKHVTECLTYLTWYIHRQGSLAISSPGAVDRETIWTIVLLIKSNLHCMPKHPPTHTQHANLSPCHPDICCTPLHPVSVYPLHMETRWEGLPVDATFSLYSGSCVSSF